MRRFFTFPTKEEMVSFQDEISRQNRSAIRFFAAAGIPVSVASIAAQFICKGYVMLMQNGAWMLLYFILLSLASTFIIPAETRYSTLLVYLLQAPVLVMAMLLGTVWDPNTQALTYMMFMVVMPVFVLDRPGRVIGVMAGWNVVFMILCLTVKAPKTHLADFLHMMEFFLASIAVTLVVLKLRFDVMRSHERTRYHLEHDSLTGACNRLSLEGRIESYLNKPILLLMADLDQMSLINDYYGREYGDSVLLSFSAALQELFGQNDVYRYGGDEMLCVLPACSDEELLPRLEQCRERLAQAHEKRQAYVTCSFSYVSGRAKDTSDFRNMIQLAEIQVHKAGRLQQDSTIGKNYTAAELRAAIVDANLSAHLTAYETNKLTGLPGADYFISHSGELLESVVYLEQRPVVGIINVVHFSDFNDRYGYTQGDELLRTLAKLLHEVFPQRHLAYINAGRFAVLCYMDEVEPGLNQLIERLRAARSDVCVELKAGFAEYHRGDSVISLLDLARLSHDSAYREKGRLYRFYDAKLDEERRFRQYIVSHIDEAIEQDWIKAYFQPIIRSLTGEICNMEALARWVDPKYGFIMPGRFISALEDEGLVYKLNLHMVRLVLRAFQAMEQQGLPLVPVSVNLSRRDFTECDMVQEITALVDAAGYPHSLLKIEITESAFMEDTALLKQALDRFHTNGFEVWMDDFGSEYSTLNLLHDLSFDMIKIDMKFMEDFSSSKRNSIIIDDVIAMSKQLGTTTLVEGVETQQHYAALRRLGSEKLQGFYFSRPLPLQDILRLAGTRDWLRMEQGENAAYYTLLGRINLHSALSSSAGLELNGSHTLPAGIIEINKDDCKLIRGNDSLFSIAKQRSSFHLVENSPVPRSEVPEIIVQALANADPSGRWTCTHARDVDGNALSLYVQRITESPEHSVAMLLVILPG